MIKIMLSNEFLEQIAAGRKEFEDMELHYADMDGHRFEGLTFRNCEFFFGTFRGSDFQKVEFIGCGFDYGGFVEASFAASRMIRCRRQS